MQNTLTPEQEQKLLKDYDEAKACLNVAARITYELSVQVRAYEPRIKAEELNKKIKKTLLKIQ